MILFWFLQCTRLAFDLILPCFFLPITLSRKKAYIYICPVFDQIGQRTSSTILPLEKVEVQLPFFNCWPQQAKTAALLVLQQLFYVACTALYTLKKVKAKSIVQVCFFISCYVTYVSCFLCVGCMLKGKRRRQRSYCILYCACF